MARKIRQHDKEMDSLIQNLNSQSELNFQYLNHQQKKLDSRNHGQYHSQLSKITPLTAAASNFVPQIASKDRLSEV